MNPKVNPAKIRYIQNNLLRWIKKNKRTFPWRNKDVTPYKFLVAEIMLKKTSAKGVTNIYKKFISKYPTPSKLAAGKLSEIKIMVTSLGLYNSRSLLLRNIGILLRNDKSLLNNRAKLLKVKGLGQYVVNALNVFSLGQRYPIVDRNVLRIYSRYFGIPFNSDPRRDKNIDKIAWRCLPLRYYRDFNYALLDLSNAVCVAEIPLCRLCPLKKHCTYYYKQAKPCKYLSNH